MFKPFKTRFNEYPRISRIPTYNLKKNNLFFLCLCFTKKIQVGGGADK
jgi:hypothetical protein